MRVNLANTVEHETVAAATEATVLPAPQYMYGTVGPKKALIRHCQCGMCQSGADVITSYSTGHSLLKGLLKCFLMNTSFTCTLCFNSDECYLADMCTATAQAISSGTSGYYCLSDLIARLLITKQHPSRCSRPTTSEHSCKHTVPTTVDGIRSL